MVSKEKTRIIISIKNENLGFLDFLSANLQETRSNLIDALLEQYKNWYLTGGKKDEK